MVLVKCSTNSIQHLCEKPEKAEWSSVKNLPYTNPTQKISVRANLKLTRQLEFDLCSTRKLENDSVFNTQTDFKLILTLFDLKGTHK